MFNLIILHVEDTMYRHQSKLYVFHISQRDLMNFSATNMFLSSDRQIPSIELCTGFIQSHNQKCWFPTWITVSSIAVTISFCK